MFETDLLVAFAFMAVLFLRQISILKQPNKINYAPLMIGIGAISSVVHFIIHPDASDVVLLVRESLFPFLVALLLYIVMNILHQTQVSEHTRSQDEFTKVLVGELSQLKEFILELEGRMNTSHQEDLQVQAEIRSKIKDDIGALGTIQENQTRFLDKFDDMESWHDDVSKGFEHFTAVQLPELNNIVHKHIDILRVSEQDHYNKITSVLSKAVESRGGMSSDLEEMKSSIDAIRSVSKDIAKSVTRETIEQLSGVTKAFQGQIISLKSHTESIKITLSESDNRLDNIKDKSEIIMKQMNLSSKKMNELEAQNRGLQDVYLALKNTINDVESIRSEYVKSQSQLSNISTELATNKDEQIVAMKNRIDDLSDTLSQKIDDSLSKLHEHYHIAEGEISPSVQMLAKRAQLKNGYTEFDK